MKFIKAILALIIGVLAGMRGGQKDKIVRRAGVPLTILGFSLSIQWKWKYLAFLLLFPILSMGYGVDSTLGSFVGYTEWLIRLIYALLVSIPFFIFGWRRMALTAIFLIIAYQIHAGSLGYTLGFGDWLIEDLVRFGTLMLCAIINISCDK